MNIDDAKSDETGGDKLAKIFQRQRMLIDKYHDDGIDKGLPGKIPVDLNDSKGQVVLKDFAWRFTEELGEALEALIVHHDITDHFDEEISDALHFLVEFTILSGMDEYKLIEFLLPKPLCGGVDMLDMLYTHSFLRWMDKTPDRRNHRALATQIGYLIESLAITCNTLKNKPWKQTQMMTDEDYFKKNLVETWLRFIQLCITAGISMERLYDLYFRKSEVNKFRQRSNY